MRHSLMFHATVANSAALSSGRMFHLPVISEREWRRIASLQAALARKRRGSRNREKARRRLARYRQALACRKHDAIHKATTMLVLCHPMLAIEDLHVQAMSASAKGTAEQPGVNVAGKAGLNRAILDQCWGEMERQLAYKCERYGRELRKVPARDTSRQCPACGHTAKENRESQAVFHCRSCGHRQHADTSAAQVVLQRALQGHGEITVRGPSGGTPGCGSREARNACEDRAALRTPKRPGPSRKNPRRRGNPKLAVSPLTAAL